MRRNFLTHQVTVIVLILLVGLLAYANSFTVPFQFDDDSYIVNNPAIRSFHFIFHPAAVDSLFERSPTALPIALRYAFTTRIVGYLSFAVNYQLHGLHVVGYHVVNLMIHIACAVLVYLIIAATFNTPFFAAWGPRDDEALRGLMAAAPALLFVSHPLQTQAVTYLTQRFTSLAACFFLLSLLLYIKARTGLPGSRRFGAYAGSLLAAVAAMLTKEFTVTLPVVIALYELSFLDGKARDRVKVLAPFAVTLAIIPALVFFKQGSLSALDSTMRTFTAADVTNISRTDYLLTQFRVIMLYLRLLFVPAGQNVDHDVPVYHSLFALPVLASFLALLALFLLGAFLYALSRRNRAYPELRLAAFGIAWFFITLSVESSVIPLGELVAEYRLYLPSVGMLAAVVSLASFAARRYSRVKAFSPVVLRVLLAACVAVFSTATFQRNLVWASETALWEDAARKSPGRVRPHQNLGLYYESEGRLEDAERELRAALLLAPDNFELHNNLGVVYKKRGAYEPAAQEYRTVLELAPGDVMARYNLGNLYLEQGRTTDAVREYEITVGLIPDYDEAHNNLGIAYQRAGRTAEAVREFDRALQLNPNNEHARMNREACLGKAAPAATGRKKEAPGPARAAGGR